MTTQQSARDRAVASLKELMRTYVPDLGEESRDVVREWIEHAVDDLVRAFDTPAIEAHRQKDEA